MDAAALTAIPTLAIALAVALIHRGQMLTARAKLRQELFDRRYAIYEKVSQFVADVCVSGSVPEGEDIRFLRETKLAYFAFGCDEAIKGLVDDIHQHAVRLQVLQKKEGSLLGSTHDDNIDRQTEEKEWFRMTLVSLETKFQRHLKLDIV